MNLNLGESVAIAMQLRVDMILPYLSSVNRPKPEYFNDIFLSEMTIWKDQIPNLSLYAVINSIKK